MLANHAADGRCRPGFQLAVTELDLLHGAEDEPGTNLADALAGGAVVAGGAVAVAAAFGAGCAYEVAQCGPACEVAPTAGGAPADGEGSEIGCAAALAEWHAAVDGPTPEATEDSHLPTETGR